MEDQKGEKKDPFEFLGSATPSLGLWSHGVHLGWKETDETGGLAAGYYPGSKSDPRD